MSQWSGTFSVQNQYGDTIYNLSVSHTASGCPSQTPIKAASIDDRAWAGGGRWQTETTSNDNWYWSYHVGGPNGTLVQGNEQCNLERSDASAILYIGSRGVSVHPNSSANCYGRNS